MRTILIALATLANVGHGSLLPKFSLTMPRVRAHAALSGLVPLSKREPEPEAKPLTPLALGGRALGSSLALVLSGWLPSLAPQMAYSDDIVPDAADLASLPWEVVPAAIVLSLLTVVTLDA